ncbi:MAG TPA: glycoside hydrolase family 25 protein [Chitinophagaceae bacterium]|nr:glycoside hydrolase family 25 protein [Chitinophagaceae bacterium]
MFSARQKKKIRRYLFLSALVIVISIIAIVIFQWSTHKKVRFVRYPEFGIAIPENYMIHGIDVSKYQDKIDWNEVKAMQVKQIQLGFAFIKATEGIKNKDPHFKRNWEKAKDAGVIRGAYHFFIASKDGQKQAENFINNVKTGPGDLPPVLDVEQLNGSSALQLRAELKKWLNVVENHFGVKPIIYTNVDFYHRYLGSEFDQYPLWVAHYYQLEKPQIKRNWIFWQHSDAGRVNGIYSKVDFNVFNGDSAAFRSLLIP